jgi:glutathione-regulated potassium-efflux system ancillary protein KefC/glutathione-regulated potassium-efflux system protein KefB
VIAKDPGGGCCGPVLRVIAESRIQEIFTAAAGQVIGVSLLMVGVGLSMSLGAFLAGVLLADSEYRHGQPTSGPSKACCWAVLHLGGDGGRCRPGARPAASGFAGVIGLMGVKAAALYVLRPEQAFGRLRAPWPLRSARRRFARTVALAEGSQVMDRGLVDLLVVVVTLSMAATPLALLATDIIGRRLRAREPAKPFDTIDAGEQPPVIIAGFGRVGQIVSRILLARGIPITALDIDPAQVETVRQFGRKVYYGDASRLDLLQAAGTEKAKLFVLAVDNVEKSLLIAETLKKHFPHVKVFARARNRFHAYRLMDIGLEYIMRETLLSSLQMAEEVLQALGTPAWQAREIAERFRLHDERILQVQHAVYHDETQLRQTSREAMQELDALLRGDREDAQADGARHTVFSPSDIR